MKLKCDICKQEELVPDTFIAPDPLIPDREITGGMRHSDWTICIKILMCALKIEKEAHEKTAKQFVDQKSYADCVEIKLEKLKKFLESIHYEIPHKRHCHTIDLMVSTECNCRIGEIEKEIEKVLHETR